MSPLESLPADQRAVLELVLRRGRGYDDIARLLSIDRRGVRQRALGALDALGPETGLDSVRRALITDYLLGQLPAGVADEVKRSLARSPTERAWARVLASELAPLAREPLPEIPAAEEADAPLAGGPAPASASTTPAGAPARAERPAAPSKPGDTASPRQSSRVGGAILLGLGAVVVVAVVLVLLLTGGSSKRSSSAAASTNPTTSTAAASTTASARLIAAINLNSPSTGGKAKGIAQVVQVASSTGIVIYATGVPANGKDAYAVWLYNSPSDSHRLGFVSQKVGSDGRLQTTGPLPANASRYKQLLVTLETQSNPATPGKIVLQGNLSLH